MASDKCITSEIAGALWEWPPAVCGRHTDEKSLERSKVWCMDSYAKFMELAMKPKETGAYLRQSVFYFKDKVKDLPSQTEKMNELCYLPGFRHDSKLIKETGKSSEHFLSTLILFTPPNEIAVPFHVHIQVVNQSIGLVEIFQS